MTTKSAAAKNQAGSGLPFGIYDSHTHVWASNRLPNRFTSPAVLTESGSAEGLIKCMDENGVIKSLVITPMTLGFDNSLTLDVSYRYPGSFLPIVRIDLRSPNHLEAFRELYAFGAKGLRINLSHLKTADFLLDSQYSKLWIFLSDEQIPLFIHCESSQFHIVSQIVSQHSKMKVIIDHMGRISSRDGISAKGFLNLLELSESPNVYIKISSTNYFAEVTDSHSDLTDYIALIVQRFSADRLLWGSDWPFSENDGTYRSSFEPLLSMDLVDKQRTLEKIFATNFKDLFQCA